MTTSELYGYAGAAGRALLKVGRFLLYLCGYLVFLALLHGLINLLDGRTADEQRAAADIDAQACAQKGGCRDESPSIPGPGEY